MKNNFFIACILAFAFVTIFPSCKKEEGPGGNSTIYGTVWVLNYNQELTLKLGEHWAQEEHVYLMYGNDTIPSDNAKTGYNGTYWFKYLQKGDYTIFAYSEDTTLQAPSGKFPVKINVTIGEEDETVQAPSITIIK